MKTAVIYARYSSDRQNEMSIDGQIAECKRYAEANDLLVIQEYIDRAQSATTDKRPNFRRMITDSEDQIFDIILVYQLDRFARNKNDSGYYKKILADNGVKVVSAKEQIAEDSSGVITEGMLEIVADWFSKQLSEKVSRGMLQNAEKCKYNGGVMPLGFTKDENGYYALDPEKAPIVKEIFERYASGETGKEIMKDLNDRGITTARGTPFSTNSLQKILRNERYKGVYVYKDLRKPGGIPRIVSDELFDKVQAIHEGKPNRGHMPATEDYILTGKLYCGICKSGMSGKSGHSHTGTVHRYYRCFNASKNCDRKNVRKEWIESEVIKACQSMMTDDIINILVADAIQRNKEDQESPAVTRIQGEIKETKKKIETLIDQIESGTSSSNIAERLTKRESQLEDLMKQLRKEQAKQKPLDPQVIRNYLEMLRTRDLDDLEQQKMLIRAFVDRIYLYDDHFDLLLNSSSRGGSATHKTEEEVKSYFFSQGSPSAHRGVPRH